MLGRIFRILLPRSTRKAAEEAYAAGYEWATTALCEGSSPSDLLGTLDGNHPIQFDRGALDAIRDSVNKVLL